MFGESSIARVRVLRVLPVTALLVFSLLGLGTGGLMVSAARQPVPAATSANEPTISVPVRLASDDDGPDNPDADISGPYDSDEDNIAPPPPASGFGMECEDEGVGCDDDESGTVLTSDNDEV